MTLTQPFYTTVPESETITLPPEYRGTEIMIHETAPKKMLPMDSREFPRRKTLDEIATEQGGPRICTNPAEILRFSCGFLGLTGRSGRIFEKAKRWLNSQ